MQQNNYNEELTIVLIGSFAPLMFSPEWFEKNEVINKDDLNYVKSGKNTIVTPAFTYFETDSLRVRIEENRFTLTSRQTPFAVFVEMFKKIFFGLDSLTINAFGLNYFSSMKFDEEKFELLGNKICPKKYWETFYDNQFESKKMKGGLSSLSLSTPTLFGTYNFTVQSNKNYKYYVDFISNFHNQNSNGEKFTISEVSNLISEKYQEFEKKHTDVINDMLNIVFKNEK